MKLSSLFHRQLTSKREKFKRIFLFLWTKLCLLRLEDLSVYKRDCTDYLQRQNSHFLSCNRFPSEQSTAKVVAYHCMHVSMKKSLSFAWPWEIWKRDKTRPTACRKPTAEVAMLRLFRDEHIY